MTDDTPDNAPETASETPENAARGESAPEPGDSPPEGGRGDAGAPEAEAVPAAMEEDGVAMHIVQPHDPGTILVAVAEPTDLPCGTSAEAPQGASRPVPEAGIPRFGDLVAVAAVRLGGLGPALFFAAGGINCAAGDAVVVEMEEGQAFGEVASVMRMNPDHLEDASGEVGKIRPVIRVASEKDIAAAENNRVLAVEALDYCRGCVRDRNLDMKLVDVLILHDRSKMVFYFTAPARIDFRELVKDLVRRYRTRIELRQIGVRHETQMVGALGNCGMVCCCRRYLRKFAPVAIKMAKEQNVFLNPVKISGICGRLLCCLAYEQGHYDEFYRSCPKLGKKYHTDAGVFRVLRASLFRESVSVLSDAGEELEFPLAEWNSLNPFRPNAPQQQQARRVEQPDGESRQRKPDRRGGRPPLPSAPAVQPDLPVPSGQTQAAPEKRHGPGSVDSGDDAPRETPVRESTALVVREERTVVQQNGGSVHVSESRAVSAVFGESLRPGEPDAATADAPLDEADDGGSIFGLSPRRSAPREPGGEDHRDAGNRRKRPRRRKPRTPDSQGNGE